MALYLDTEFTGLDRDSELISLALVDDEGRALYLERSGLSRDGLDPWIGEHVLPVLREPLESIVTIEPVPWDSEDSLYARGDLPALRGWLLEWLSPYHRAPVWVDMGAWDWFHFAALFGGALALPDSVEMYPVELSTWLRANGRAFDEPRSAIVPAGGTAHHALDDARHMRAVVLHLLGDDGEGDE